MLNNCTKNGYSDYWQPMYRIYVLSRESVSFNASQFQSHHNTGFLNEEWRRHTAFQCFQTAIYSILIYPAVFEIYSLTSLPLLIQFLLLDFHDIPEAIFKIWTMCTRSEQRIVQLNAWLNVAWQSSFIRVCIAHWPLLLWLKWHPRVKFCF